MNNKDYSIVIVDDDELLLELYEDVLCDEGYQVRAFKNRHDALISIQKNQPNLVILDVCLENEIEGGIILCNLLRQKFLSLPIIFLSSHSSESSQLKGLKCQVEDYLSKESSIDFILVKISTLLERISNFSNIPDKEINILQRGNLQLDTEEKIALWKGHPVQITLKQYEMLQELALTPGQAKTASKLMSVANMVVEPNTIASNIKAIRKQFKKIDPNFSLIKAEYGSGYRWVN